MPIQTPQWTDFLICPVCENGFELKTRLPISLGCGHSVCKTCLANLQRNVCPFDQTSINIPLDRLPVNTALVLLIDPDTSLKNFRTKAAASPTINDLYNVAMQYMEQLATFLRPSNSQTLSRPMQRKLVALINCQLLEEEGRARTIRSARSLGERSVTELILQHQNPQQLSANLWAAVRTRGCQFLGPAMQEEVLKLVLLALEDGSALSRKVLVMFVVQRLEPHFPQASKTSIGHVVQLLYRASCFIVTKRDGDSSLMQLKDEFRTYESLRREHDAQIVQVATEAGLRIAPDQWSSLLYGDTNHKSHMQSIIDKLQTPQSFVQSVQELVIALQRTGDPGKLASLRPHLDLLSGLDTSSEANCSDWSILKDALNACVQVVSGLLNFISLHSQRRTGIVEPNGVPTTIHSRYKTSMCRDLTTHSSCPRGKHCTFAHSQGEIEQYRQKRGRIPSERENISPSMNGAQSPPQPQPMISLQQRPYRLESSMTPVAQVVPVPRELVPEVPPPMLQVLPPPPPNGNVLPMFDSYGPIPIVHALPGPPPEILHPGQTMVPVIGTLQPGPGQMGSVMSPPIQLHYSQLIPADQEWCQVLQTHHMQDQIGEMQRQSVAAAQAKTMHSLATKSLSALKSRKDEIIDSLEDLVGKDETKKISHVTSERATTLQNLQNLTTDDRGAYSMWSTQYLCTQPPPIGLQVDEEHQPQIRLDDDLIPFSDTPQISRFGPISRRMCPQTIPTQSQAVIGDETKPTSVVRHTKHMSRPVPAAASLLHQNGTRTTLQPVAVGMNGEIGYIAIAETPVVMAQTSDMTMQHLHQSTLVSPVHLSISAPANMPAEHVMDPQTTGLMAESERMRHRLELLQMKISSLNLARMSGLPPPPTIYPSTDQIYCGGGEKEQLTSELQLIENSIQDREREIKINHQRNEAVSSAE